MISILYGVGQTQPFQEECLWGISSKRSFWATPLFHFRENGWHLHECVHRNVIHKMWDETQVSSLIVAGGLNCRHLKTKALNALSTGYFLLVVMLFLPQQVSAHNEHRVICPQSFLKERNSHWIFHWASLHLLWHLLADINGPIWTAIIKVGERNGTSDIDG